MNETKNFNTGNAPKASSSKRPGAAGVAAAALGAVAGAGAMGAATTFEKGLESLEELKPEDITDSENTAYNDTYYSAPDEPVDDNLAIVDFDPNDIVIDPTEFEDVTVETGYHQLAYEPITAEDLILDPESLDIEVMDNDVLFADEPGIDAEFDADDIMLADIDGLPDESTYNPYMPDSYLSDNDADNAFGNDIIDDLMA